MSSIYEDIKLKQGKIHEHLEMDLNYSTMEVMKVSTIPYIRANMSKLLGKITKTAALPAVQFLFNARDVTDSKILPD